MIKQFKDNRSHNLKTKMLNILMKNGKKKTGEKILLKSVKDLQKLSTKNSKNLFQLAVINSTPTFKLNEQILKKGKRKAVKITPYFIVRDSLRTMTSLKFIKFVAGKSRSSNTFYKSITQELLSSAFLRTSQAVEKKNELQKQVLLNKRYLSKFRW